MSKFILQFVVFWMASTAHAATSCNGAGSTFVEPIFTKWFAEFSKVNPEMTFNYQGIGSGGGIRQVIAGTVDFGATDAPMNDEEMKQANQDVLHLPVVMGAVVVSYNLPLKAPLKMTGALVGDIFSGKIVKWDDAAIAKLNPGVKLPSLPIIVATRSDGSGTTAIFSGFLAGVSEDWKGKAGKSVQWFKGSMGAKGNAGVAGFIKQAEGTVGYVELVYALENKLDFAQIKNSAGQFVTASPESVTLALSKKKAAELEKASFKGDLLAPDAKGAYPISGMTWILIPKQKEAAKTESLTKLLSWIYSEEAQKHAVALNFAPLPKEMRAKLLSQVKTIK